MLEGITRFDMNEPPRRQKLRPLIWALCFPDVWAHKNKLTKINMEGVKPPYLLLCNHNAFMDFKVAVKACFPNRANYVVAIDGFIGREGLLRTVGGICKRKFTNDITLIRQLKKVIDNGDIATVYPEARYSLCGTTAVLPESLEKLAKLLKVPVVTLICHGHHVNSPFWNVGDRKVKPTEAEMTCVATAEELQELSHEEVMERIEKAFQYDDFKWQKDRGILVKYRKRAEGLHKVLYQCPNCETEYKMSSSGTTLKCDFCGKHWEMNEDGTLSGSDGVTEFSHIPDWYEWERANVRHEVECGEYSVSLNSVVNALPNAKKFINIGNAKFTHNEKGFTLEGNANGEFYSLNIPVPDAYSVHIEYEYLGKYGDCVDLNTLKDTLYVHPLESDYSVTKIALATEELYNKYWREKKAEKEPE
ncbi:MAG: hypothetical protein IJR55_06585 [Clostridia bacterium]|nr:hypothetical protein [Clostridia bacterium]